MWRFALVCLTGCSLVFVRGPTSPTDPGNCSETAYTPIGADIALGIAAAATGAVAFDEAGEVHRTRNIAIGAAAIPVAVLFLLSAATGYARTKDCADAHGGI